MTITSTGLIGRAYQAFKPKGIDALSARPDIVGSSKAGNFGGMIRDIVSSASSTMRRSEAISQAALEGRASTQAMVEAVMEAETTLTAVINVRDRMVQAYQDVMRMAI